MCYESAAVTLSLAKSTAGISMRMIRIIKIVPILKNVDNKIVLILKMMMMMMTTMMMMVLVRGDRLVD